MSTKETNKLSIEELKDNITYYKDNLGNESIQIDIMYAKKTSSKKKPYKTYMLSCLNADIAEVLDKTLENMIDICNARTIDKYDLEISTDNTIQAIEEGKVLNYSILKSNLSIEYLDENVISEKTNYDGLDFAYIQISDNVEDNPRKPLTILKRHYKSPAKFKGSKRIVFNGTEAKAFTKRLFVINSNVEAFHINGYFYILDRNSFNSMMNFKDIYYKVVDDKTKEIHDSELFDNANSFIEDCKNDGRHVVRLTKAILANGFKNAKDNKDKLPKLKKNYNLKLKFTADGKIVYEKEHMNEILNLLLEHYVTSALTEKRMLALAIERYE